MGLRESIVPRWSGPAGRRLTPPSRPGTRWRSTRRTRTFPLGGEIEPFGEGRGASFPEQIAEIGPPGTGDYAPPDPAAVERDLADHRVERAGAGCLGDKHVSRGGVGKIATQATALAVIVQGLLCAPSLIST